MPIAAIETPRSRQDELGQFLTAVPMASFMASMLGPRRGAPRSAARERWALLVKAIIEVFCARWSPGSTILGVCDPNRKIVHLDANALATLGVTLDSAAKSPDVIVHDRAKNRLLLIEAVTSAGPVDGQRRQELNDLFAGCKADLVFVTAFENRRMMQTFAAQIAWESEVWMAEDPEHMIHFNGGRFRGPYPDAMPARPTEATP
jgi:hypothetical protein